MGRLLKQPELLLELQERVLIDGGAYWESLPLEPELVAAVQQGWQRLSSERGLSAGVEHVSNVLNSSSITSTLETCSTTESLRQARRIVVAAAAMVLIAFGLWLLPKPNQPLLAWGWNRPGTFAADQYLDRLADRADEWHQRPHETPDQLRNDLTDFRQACLTLLDATYDPLPPEQRDELKKCCGDERISKDQ